MLINVSVDVVDAQYAFTEFFPACLDLCHEGRILHEPFEHGRGGVGFTALINPGFNVVAVGKVAVSICQVVVPDSACVQLSACSVGILLVLVEIGAALQSVGIQAQFGMYYVIHE